jgi:galactonate dehydratase
MKITAIETFRLEPYSNFIWVQVHTDDGLIGLGETMRDGPAVEAYLHTTVAPYLLGKDPQHIERHNRHLLEGFLGFESTGIETRAAASVDIALWDILGKATGQPLHQLLGGLVRDRIGVYNTCAGSDSFTTPTRRVILPGDTRPSPGRYNDHVAWVNNPDELAESLIEEGYRGMKIWPFDSSAVGSGGTTIVAAQLKAGLEPFEQIRRAVGDRIEVMCEMHSVWNLPSARRIAKALELYDPYWIEDPLKKMNNVAGLSELAGATTIPIAGGETLASRAIFRDLLNAQALAFVIVDLGWCGGVSEARKMAALADTYQRPIAFHDCSGPVVLTASSHLSLNISNAIFQEVVRAYLFGWYRDVVTELPRVEGGYLYPMHGAGLGLSLQPDLIKRPGTIHRRTAGV